VGRRETSHKRYRFFCPKDEERRKRMRTTTRRLLAAGIILGFASAGFAAPNAGDPAPDFTEPDTAGVMHTLSDYTGNAILLNFWQST
jgi:hypothetical protein